MGVEAAAGREKDVGRKGKRKVAMMRVARLQFLFVEGQEWCLCHCEYLSVKGMA